jgi:hypothetical protein
VPDVARDPSAGEVVPGDQRRHRREVALDFAT